MLLLTLRASSPFGVRLWRTTYGERRADQDRRLGRHGSKSLLAALALILAGCASQRSVTTSTPHVTITQLSRVAPLRMTVEGGLPVDFRLSIENPLDQALTLVSVEVETVGQSGAYVMKRVRHQFQRTIPAHGRDELDFRAWVYAQQESETGDVNGPVMLRGVASFQSTGGVVRSSFSSRAQ